MAGEGSMMHAIHTMRNNKALLKDKRRNSWKNYLGNKDIPTEYAVEATPELLAEIKEKFRLEKKRKVKENIIYLFLTILSLCLISYLIYKIEFVGIQMDLYK